MLKSFVFEYFVCEIFEYVIFVRVIGFDTLHTPEKEGEIC